MIYLLTLSDAVRSMPLFTCGARTRRPRTPLVLVPSFLTTAKLGVARLDKLLGRCTGLKHRITFGFRLK